MKHILTAALAFLSFSAYSQTHSLEQLWQTDTVIAVPESVLPEKDVLYVSLIDGAPWGADGKGGVAKLGLNGEIIDTAWITGLNAPKGMGRVGNKLYVADINNVVVIDIKKGAIDKKISIEGAEGLNDITVSDKGVVYVSDSKKANIWRIEKDVPALYLENMTGVNGLKAIKNDLLIGSGKSFVKADANKKTTIIAEMPETIDGIEPVGNGDFIVTSWIGWVYYVTAGGKIEVLLDTHLQKINTADIGYNTAKRILYVPTFNGKRVVAYKLK